MKYLLVPIIKNPYSRIGPKRWQDWCRQIERTVGIARALEKEGNGVRVALLSHFHHPDQPSEIEIYAAEFQKLAPELGLDFYRETCDTRGQVDKSFELKEATGSELIFVSAWMQFPRVLYLAQGREALHYGVFGIPQPAFALIDPFCMIVQPIVDMLGLGTLFQRMIVREREKGRIL